MWVDGYVDKYRECNQIYTWLDRSINLPADYIYGFMTFFKYMFNCSNVRIELYTDNGTVFIFQFVLCSIWNGSCTVLWWWVVVLHRQWNSVIYLKCELYCFVMMGCCSTQTMEQCHIFEMGVVLFCDDGLCHFLIGVLMGKYFV